MYSKRRERFPNRPMDCALLQLQRECGPRGPGAAAEGCWARDQGAAAEGCGGTRSKRGADGNPVLGYLTILIVFGLSAWALTMTQ